MGGAFSVSRVVAFDWTPEMDRALGSGIRVVVIVAVGIVINAVARRAVGRFSLRMQQVAGDVLDRAPEKLVAASKRRDARAQTVSSVLRGVTSAVVLTVVTLLVLGEVGVNLAPLLAGAGIASVAIGFGTQSLVRDVVAGLFVLIEDQYGVGDTIDAGEANGTVERVTLRSTQLRDLSGTLWHIPNGVITRVGNKSQDWSRAVVDVVVDAEADLTVARRTFAVAAQSMFEDPVWSAKVHGEPNDMGVQALDAAGATLRVVLDTQPGAQWSVERELRQRAKAALDAAGVALARPPAPRPPIA